MMRLSPRARARAVRAGDIAMVVWVIAWLVTGFFVGLNMYELRQIADTTEAASDALAETADLVRVLDGLPAVGDDIGALAEEIDQTAAEAQVSATRSRDNVADLAWLLGIVVVVIPVVPLLAGWVPYRLGRRRELDAVQAALAETGQTAAVDEYLAHRAVANLAFHELREVSDAPWEDLRQGRFRPLADAELNRLGIVRPWD